MLSQAQLGGKESPSEADVKAVLASGKCQALTCTTSAAAKATAGRNHTSP